MLSTMKLNTTWLIIRWYYIRACWQITIEVSKRGITHMSLTANVRPLKGRWDEEESGFSMNFSMKAPLSDESFAIVFCVG